MVAVVEYRPGIASVLRIVSEQSQGWLREVAKALLAEVEEGERLGLLSEGMEVYAFVPSEKGDKVSLALALA